MKTRRHVRLQTRTHPAFRPLLWLPSLILLLALGCATQPELSTLPEGASLEIVNATDHTLRIAIHGRHERTLPPLRRARVHHLPPGTTPVLAQTEPGVSPPFIRQAELLLERGERQQWQISPTVAQHPLPEIPALCRLEIQNTTEHALLIRANGQRLGRLFPGEARVFHDLDSGPTDLSASPDDGGDSREKELTLTEFGPNVWKIRPRSARLTVRNQHAEPVKLQIDGRERATIAAHGLWYGRVRPGTRQLEATFLHTQILESQSLQIDEGAQQEWDLRPVSHPLDIENLTEETLQIVLPGQDRHPLPPGTRHRFTDLPPTFIAKALGQDSSIVYARQLNLSPSHVPLWTIRPYARSLRVENTSQRPAKIYLQGALDRPPLAEIPPGATTVLADLPPTPFTLQAQLGDQRLTTHITAESPQSVHWSLQHPHGRARITHTGDTPLRLYIDAVYTATLQPGETRLLSGIETGTRRFEAVTDPALPPQRQSLNITADATASWQIGPTDAQLTVTNQTRETLYADPALANQYPKIAAGQTLVFRIPAGQRPYLFKNDSGALHFTKELQAQPGAELVWELVRQPVNLRIWSALNEDAAITLNGRSVGLVSPSSELLLEGINPGRHQILAMGLSTQHRQSYPVNLQPGKEARLKLDIQPAQLIVHNHTDDTIAVRLGGEDHGTLSPGQRTGYAIAQAGPLLAEIHHPKNALDEQYRLNLRQGQRERLDIHPPMGTLRLQNRSHQPLNLYVDGKLEAEISADADTTYLAIPTGQRRIRVERLRDQNALQFQLWISAKALEEVVIPATHARLIVVNQATVDLELYVGDHHLGGVQAGSSRTFESLEAATVTLQARQESGEITHQERRQLQAGSTSTWLLAP